MALALFFGGAEETEQALPIKGIRHPAQGALSQAGFLGTRAWRDAEKDTRANPLIQALFRRVTPLLDQVVMIGALPSFSFRFGYGLACCATRRFWPLL
jgi:hypothetical protein